PKPKYATWILWPPFRLPSGWSGQSPFASNLASSSCVQSANPPFLGPVGNWYCRVSSEELPDHFSEGNVEMYVSSVMAISYAWNSHSSRNHLPPRPERFLIASRSRCQSLRRSLGVTADPKLCP